MVARPAPAGWAQAERPVSHKFGIGQAVDLTPTPIRFAATGEYEILRLLPGRDNDPGNPCYGVRNISEKYERVVFESEITLSPPRVPSLS
jgi:hypothetical protein